MKRYALLLAMAIVATASAFAQKFALVDMEYILANIPQYEMANQQLDQLSSRWQKEVEDLGNEAQQMYQQYLTDKVFLTDEQAKKREEDIVKKEQAASDLKYKYFGPEGELYKKRQTLLKPIQEDVYNAVKKISEEKGYQVIFDRASSSNIIFASPKIDISNEVLNKLGYGQ